MIIPSMFHVKHARSHAMRSTLILLSLAAALTACSGAEETPDDVNAPPDMAEMGQADMHTAPDLDAADMTMADMDAPELGPAPAIYDGLVINEVAAAGEPNDWFELYNGAANSISLDGVTFSDDPTKPAQGKLPAGTTLMPGAYLAVDVTDAVVGFKLGSDEQLGLYAPGGQRIDLADWADGQSPSGKSFGRIPNGDGPFTTLDTPTRGAANVPNMGPVVCGDGMIGAGELCDGAALGGASCEGEGFASGVLACAADCEALETSGCVEKMARVLVNEACATGDDRIELFNAGDAPAQLAGWRVVDAGYDLAMGPDTANNQDHSYTFMAGATLEPGAFLVLVKDVDHLFGLGKSDEVILLDAAGMIVDRTGLWADDAAQVSWCRDAAGQFKSCAMATFGAANQP
jgi:hypothetical protein